MKHTLVTFTLHRRGVVLLALGSLLAAALLFVGGCLVGEWRAGRGAEVEAGAPGSGSAAADGLAAGEPGDGSAGATAMPPGSSGMPERYTLRLGTFPTEEEAKALADRLTSRGYPATLGQASGRTGVTLHLVLVGSYGTRWEARGAAAELERREARERWEAVVVPAPQQ